MTPEFITGFFFEAIKTAMLLAAPMLIALFLSEFGLGLINRFAPQLNVFFLSMPIKSAVAVLILIFYFRFFISYLKTLLIQNADVLNALKFVVK